MHVVASPAKVSYLRSSYLLSLNYTIVGLLRVGVGPEASAVLVGHRLVAGSYKSSNCDH